MWVRFPLFAHFKNVNKMQEIQYIEDTISNYGHRTFVNASLSDATIAFAVDFTTSGEICTKNAVNQSKKIYIPINIREDFNIKLDEIASKLQNCSKLNIAGNGIMTLNKYGITQEECDEIVFNLLYKLINEYNCSFSEIRSGGQTGFDEAGIKASVMLGIKTICYFPKGWRYRSLSGDISDEAKFKQRFIC